MRYVDINHDMVILNFDYWIYCMLASLCLHLITIIEYMVCWHQTKHDILISNMIYYHWISILNIWYDNIKLKMVCWHPKWYVDIEFWNRDGFVIDMNINIPSMSIYIYISISSISKYISRYQVCRYRYQYINIPMVCQ